MASRNIALCPICFTCYDSEAKRPKILPCGHTFCSQCLLNITEKNDRSIACPLCKQETVVADLSQLTTNFSILDLTPYDEQEVEATSKASARVEQGPPLSTGVCDDHGQHKLFKCKSCEKWICHVCTILEHPLDKCKVISVKNALEEMKNHMNAQVEQLMAEYNQTCNQLGVYDRELPTREEDYRKTSLELEHVMEQCKAAEQSVAGEHLKLKKAQEEGLAKLQDLKELQYRVSKLSGVQEIEDCSQAVSHYKESAQTWTQDMLDMTSGKSLPFEPQSLTKSLLKLAKWTEENLVLAELLYENALEKPGSSDIYAQAFQILSKMSVHDESSKSRITLRNYVINKCQKEFEKDINEFKATRQREIDEVTNAKKKLELSLQLNNDLMKFRERSKNNIKLIGELYKLHMLTTPVIQFIIQLFLEKRDVLSLECLCILLTVTGKRYETQCHQTPKANQVMDKQFTEMKKIISDPETSNELRNLMTDVINLRQNNWVLERGANSAK